jgi:hypothetical protein
VFLLPMQGGDLAQGPGRVQLMNSLVEKDIAFVKDKITLDAV